MTDKLHKCILCNVKFTGYGNNPEPLESSNYVCCDNCNISRVIPYRMFQINLNKYKDFI